MSGRRNKHNTRHAKTEAEREAWRTLEFSREETRWVSGNRWPLSWAKEVSRLCLVAMGMDCRAKAPQKPRCAGSQAWSTGPGTESNGREVTWMSFTDMA